MVILMCSICELIERRTPVFGIGGWACVKVTANERKAVAIERACMTGLVWTRELPNIRRCFIYLKLEMRIKALCVTIRTVLEPCTAIQPYWHQNADQG